MIPADSETGWGDDLALVLTTVASEEQAAALGRTLVVEGAAACVQWHRIASCYRWQGEIEEAAEWRLQIKTLPARVDALVARLAALHAYELPEIVILAGRASHAYGQWVTDQVAAEAVAAEASAGRDRSSSVPN